jgi:hypothetical protein
MGGILTERRRVNEEGRNVVKFFFMGRIRYRVESYADDGTIRISHG